MRTISTSVCLVAVVALSAVLAASASALPEFDALNFPVKATANATFHGFEIPGLVTVCNKASFNTGEENAPPFTKDSPTLAVHPIYTECTATTVSNTGKAKVITTGCSYVFTAVAPTKNEGTARITCLTGKEIKIEPEFLSGCTISLPQQVAVGKVEYIDEQPAGKVTVNAELSKLKAKFPSACNLAGTEAEAVYRAGEVAEEKAKLVEPARPATAIFEGVPADPMEVGLNEAHWYLNHVPLAKQSGKENGKEKEEGTQFLGWGHLVINTAAFGPIECENVMGGHIYNPEGAYSPLEGVIAGRAKPGAAKIVAFQGYSCTNLECETGEYETKLALEAEELGVEVKEEVPESRGWEAQLETVGAIPINRLKIGNKEGDPRTRIQLHVRCPKKGSLKEHTPGSMKGELAPTFENGTSIGSAPSKLAFDAESGTLAAGGIEGKPAGSLKLMELEGQGLITIRHP
ncbi:MAG TPA: hypothetical protein VNY35_06640 [Solirubrobacteraceae bacterium]|jgi:hypothetical protein|nr:hypothetical protein [Solirubrobacteraceae bacterium]